MTRNPPPPIPFTPQVRERQSRGRDHYLDTSSEDEDFRDDDAPMAIGEAPKKEYTWEEKESKGFAMSVLDNPDRLMMHAHSLNDSLPSQRCRFWALLCGMRDDRPVIGQKQPPRRRQ